VYSHSSQSTVYYRIIIIEAVLNILYKKVVRSIFVLSILSLYMIFLFILIKSEVVYAIILIVIGILEYISKETASCRQIKKDKRRGQWLLVTAGHHEPLQLVKTTNPCLALVKQNFNNISIPPRSSLFHVPFLFALRF